MKPARGRPPKNEWWLDAFRRIAADHEDWGARKITQALEQLGAKEREHDEAPTERTVQRWLNTFRLSSEQEKAGYREFRWPESMTSGALPWEASTAGLELLKTLDEEKIGRPSNKVVLWFYRVTQVADDLEAYDRWVIASNLAMLDAAGKPVRIREAERFLAYAPWRSNEHAADYESRVLESLQELERLRKEFAGEEDIRDTDLLEKAHVEIINPYIWARSWQPQQNFASPTKKTRETRKEQSHGQAR